MEKGFPPLAVVPDQSRFSFDDLGIFVRMGHDTPGSSTGVPNGDGDSSLKFIDRKLKTGFLQKHRYMKAPEVIIF